MEEGGGGCNDIHSAGIKRAKWSRWVAGHFKQPKKTTTQFAAISAEMLVMLGCNKS